MSTNTMPQLPYQAQFLDASGFLSSPWADYFKQLAVRIGGNTIANSLLASGYQQFPGGLYVQWGVTGSLSSNTQTVVTFPMAFPTACFQVVAGIQGNAAGSTAATGQWGTGVYSKTGFTLNNQTSAAYTFNYFAVGN